MTHIKNRHSAKLKTDVVVGLLATMKLFNMAGICLAYARAPIGFRRGDVLFNRNLRNSSRSK